MSDKPKTSYDARDFSGLVLQADAHDVEPGTAVDQVNVQSDQEGALRVRMGVRLVSFDA